MIATMRTPDASIIPTAPNLELLQLDVADPTSIAQAVAAAGEIDVLVNNAGIGWLNALEGTPMDMIRRIFETNTFGTMAMIQAVLPQFRTRKSGTIINVTSTVTLRPLPLLSIYTASKAAVNAFTESFALELEPFNIKVKLVLPGLAPETRFGENARALAPGAFDFPPPMPRWASRSSRALWVSTRRSPGLRMSRKPSGGPSRTMPPRPAFLPVRMPSPGSSKPQRRDSGPGANHHLQSPWSQSLLPRTSAD